MPTRLLPRCLQPCPRDPLPGSMLTSFTAAAVGTALQQILDTALFGKNFSGVTGVTIGADNVRIATAAPSNTLAYNIISVSTWCCCLPASNCDAAWLSGCWLAASAAFWPHAGASCQPSQAFLPPAGLPWHRPRPGHLGLPGWRLRLQQRLCRRTLHGRNGGHPRVRTVPAGLLLRWRHRRKRYVRHWKVRQDGIHYLLQLVSRHPGHRQAPGGSRLPASGAAP